MLDADPRSNQTGAHILAGALQRHGVTKVFGQSIPSAFFLAAPSYGIAQVGYRTENAGAAMADAYARVSGQVAVVTAQNGPAATLLVPGLGRLPEIPALPRLSAAGVKRRELVVLLISSVVPLVPLEPGKA